VEAMKKIVEVERQANSLVTEARVYKTMLLNQTKKE
jgi:conjugal transfer/entry exclusion protein